nr:MAG TPA: hypothetical protein [Caudoviricetes sp.]
MFESFFYLYKKGIRNDEAKRRHMLKRNFSLYL